VENFSYNVDYRFIDRNGNVVPVMGPIDPRNNTVVPAFRASASGGFGGGGPDRVFSVDIPSGFGYSTLVRWTVTIPQQPATHGNSAGPGVIVYGRGN